MVIVGYLKWGFPKIMGYLFDGSNKKDYSILGYILGNYLSMMLVIVYALG